jgi:hypothetical protein
VIVAATLALHGCSGSTRTECVRIEDAGPADGTASVDAQTDAPPAGTCETPADLMNPDSCGPGWACDLVDYYTLALACRVAGTTEPYAACDEPAPPCAAGSVCFALIPWGAPASCAPFCDLDAVPPSCPTPGVCAFAQDTSASRVGLCLIPSDCDPVATSGCGDGTACMLLDETDGAFFCTYAGSAAPGANCTSSTACAAGYGCRGTPQICRRWCHTTDDCTTPETCTNVGQIPNHADLGYCT